jgi:hypothetical protein
VTSSFHPHLEILPEPQRELWPQLAPLAADYVLYGGTAIALRLGHRASIDFDFFSNRSLDRAALRNALPFLGEAQTLQDRLDTLTVLALPARASRPVKISFFGGIDFGRIGQPQTTTDGIAQVASLEDLLATKLKVVLQRIESKDYRDIAALIQAGAPLDRALAGARQLYGASFQPSESLKALVYFEGGDLVTLPPSVRLALIEAVSAVRHLPEVALLSKRLSRDAPIRTRKPGDGPSFES